MSVNLEEWQRRRYDPVSVWNIHNAEEEVREAELVTVNFIIGSCGIEKILGKILESRAKYASVAIREDMEKVTVEDVVWHFQKNGLDLIYMKDFSDGGGNAVRMDFENLRTAC